MLELCAMIQASLHPSSRSFMNEPCPVAFHPFRWGRAIFASATFVAMAGCAAKDAPPAAAPATEAVPAAHDAPTTLMSPESPADAADDPEAALDRAEREVEAALGNGFAMAPGQEEPQGQGTPGDVCATACRALSSMQNAAEHLCEISDDEGRCSDAKDRVARAEDRVRARCPGCE